MKKNSIYIILIFIFFLGACKKEESLFKFNDVGSNFVVSNTNELNYTSLDDETRYSIVGFDVTEVSVQHIGATKVDLGTITLNAEGKGSISVSATDMGLTEIAKSTKLTFVAKNFDGTQTITRTVTTTLKDPITITVPVVKHQNSKALLKYTVLPVYSALTGVAIQTKVAKAGTYADVLDTFKGIDTLAINGVNYNWGDTLYVKITGSTATKTATKTATIIIEANGYPKTKTFVSDTTTNSAYDLVKRRFVNITTAGDSADIEYTTTNIMGGYTVGFESNQNAQFVKVTTGADNFYKGGDILTTEATDFSAAITSDNDVAKGDVYIFRTRRGVGAYTYGLMKVISVTQPINDSPSSSIEFEFKY